MFNEVSFFHVLEHLHNVGWCLREANRVLHLEGTLIVEVPNIHSFWVIKNLLRTPQHIAGEHEEHVASYTLPHLICLLANYGFVKRSLQYVDLSWVDHKLRAMRLVKRWFYRILFRTVPLFRTGIFGVFIKKKHTL